MGQYLVIGIATRIIASTRRQDFKISVEDLRKSMEKKFNKIGVYDVTEGDDYVELELKPEVAEPDWEMMIKDFYEICYQGNKYYGLDFDKVKDVSTLEGWLDLAENDGCPGYRMADQYFFGYSDEINGWDRYISTRQKLVALSIDGKIIMECYNEVLGFFTRLIREKLGKYRLAEAVSVQICG